MEQQLDLTKDLDQLFHLYSGHELTIEGKNEIWKEPTDDRNIILSKYGIKQLMNIVITYINKNTLMAYYDSETINVKMLNFSQLLADLIYNRYEYFFYFPSPEDIFEIALPILKQEKANIDEDELYQECVKWSFRELEGRFRFYQIIVKDITDMVHSAYLRAFGGKERESMRKTISIHESSSGGQQAQNLSPNFKVTKPSTW